MRAILTLNAGSSSIKFAVYEAGAEPKLLQVGLVENLGPAARLVLKGDAKQTIDLGAAVHAAAVPAILKALQPVLQGREVAGVGHRVVHGGQAFEGPAVIDADILDQITALEPLAPLHQPHNLAGIRAAQTAFPKAIQVGCFDTSFHRGHPFVHDTYALPRQYYDQGVRRYGFHGLSYDYITYCLQKDWPGLAQGRVVIAHLGNGASMCATKNGRAISTTMGFTALDGLAMGRRVGQIDPGVLIYLLNQGMDVDQVTDLLYNQSGLTGLSGLGHDMRDLLASDDPKAAEAIDYYVTRIAREIAAMAADLGGLDGVVFCGGVGENAAVIRARVVENLGFLGLKLDADANAAGKVRIGTGDAEILVIRTDEEQIIARAVASELTT